MTHIEALKLAFEVLQDLDDCPYIVDDATVPKAGIEAAPYQVVVNMSVAWVKLQAIKQAITAIDTALKSGEPSGDVVERVQKAFRESDEAGCTLEQCWKEAIAAMNMGEHHTEAQADGAKRKECDCLRRPDSEGMPAGENPASPTSEPVKPLHRITASGCSICGTDALNCGFWKEYKANSEPVGVEESQLLKRYETLRLACLAAGNFSPREGIVCHQVAEISGARWRIDPTCMEALRLVDDMALFLKQATPNQVKVQPDNKQEG